MLSKLWSRFSVAIAVVALLAAAGLVYAADVSLNSGELVKWLFAGYPYVAIQGSSASSTDHELTSYVPGSYYKLRSSETYGNSFTVYGADVFLSSNSHIVDSTNIGARAYNSANISIPNATTTALTFNSESYDYDTIHSTSSNTGRLTAKKSGVYQITGGGAFAANATGGRQFAIRVNGSTYIGATFVPTVGGSYTTNLDVSAMYKLNLNDYVELVAFQTSGGSLNVVYAADYSPWLAMSRIP